MINTITVEQCIFSIEAISNSTSFIPGTLDVAFLNFFFSNIAISQTSVFWGRALARPSKWSFDVSSRKARFKSTFDYFLEETHGDAKYDWKQRQVLKGKLGRYLFLFTVVLTVRLCPFCFRSSDWSKSLSTPRGKEEINGPE